MPDFKFSNKEVVQMLKEVLAAMEVKNADFFRIRAYQNAIAVLDNLTFSIYDTWKNGKVSDIPGIGSSLNQHFDDLFTTGRVDEFDRVKKDLPEGMFSLIGLRGIGAKKAFKLASTFRLSNRNDAIQKLREHAQRGDIQKIPGFGEKSEKDILEATELGKMTKGEKQRMLLIKAEEIGGRILDHMSKCKGVEKMEFAGSFRRRNSTIGDLDLVASTRNFDEVAEHFLKFSEIEEVLAKGDKKVMVVLKNDIQADLRLSSPEAYGAMLQYNTGSKQHNIVLRTYALEKGLSLSEYGVKSKKSGKVEEFSNEKDFYNRLGLPYIPPEIRHGDVEVEYAVRNTLPSLIELKDIKGDLHTHTKLSADGVNTLEEMVNFASGLGYEYFGVSDHAPSIINKGKKLVEKIILDRKKEVEYINKKQNKIKVLFSFEVNITADAEMAYPDEFLEMFDYGMAAIHTSFRQDKEQITKRFISAIENKYINIIAHPVGALLNERGSYEVDWRRVFDAVRANGKILEINAQPTRLDLTYDLVRQARDLGIKMIINTDAHEASQLLFMKYGVDVVRRGWCERKDIINSYPYEELVKALKG